MKSEEHDQILPKSTLIWHEGAKVTMDYEFIDDAFNLEEKTKEDGESETVGLISKFALSLTSFQACISPCAPWITRTT